MKFIQYLNEKKTEITDLDEFNNLLHKNCKPYLKLIYLKECIIMIWVLGM